MKRLFALFLALEMLFTSTLACAEEFFLRNGITFGDTMDEVLEKETFAIKSIDDKIDDENDNTNYPCFITTERDTLAGVPNSYIVYRFDKNKTLREVRYFFRNIDSLSKDIADNDYNSINSGLIRKYGKPLGNSSGNFYAFTGTALKEAEYYVQLWKMLKGYCEISNYDEWVIETKNYQVKIEQVELYSGSSHVGWNNSHNVSYTYFTNENPKTVQDESQEHQRLVDNDL